MQGDNLNMKRQRGAGRFMVCGIIGVEERGGEGGEHKHKTVTLPPQMPALARNNGANRSESHVLVLLGRALAYKGIGSA